ncbi:MAG: deoxyribonuclease IV [Anaerostipes sp.]|jgi:deoxyribonuclease-4|nr:deoxyribonuclease IV [Anaerostipes sp.]
MLIGSHVGMKGKEMLLGSVKEALSYGANTFMVYTGAPQNTKRKDISELKIEEAKELMKREGITKFVVHAPYIINLGNSIKPETFEIATQFLELEISRTAAMGSDTLVLHPGAHVGAGREVGIAQIIKGINQVLTKDTKVNIALETMAGKGTEIGRNFDDLKAIYDGVIYNDKLRVCFDTCHVNDSGMDVVHDFDGIIDSFDKAIGKNQIAVFHLNDSKNVLGAGKDRHENIGFGELGFDAILHVVNHEDFKEIPKILETPYVKLEDTKKSFPPYKYEIAMLQSGVFDPKLKEKILEGK